MTGVPCLTPVGDVRPSCEGARVQRVVRYWFKTHASVVSGRERAFECVAPHRWMWRLDVTLTDRVPERAGEFVEDAHPPEMYGRRGQAPRPAGLDR